MLRKSALLLLVVDLMCQSAIGTDKTSITDLPKDALERSQITLPGNHPFHLKAKVVEATNDDNDDYKAEIEEFWVAPDKWRRTVKTNGFSQTIVENGDKISEQLSGNYYPHWLSTLVKAIFDPGAALQGLDLSKSSDNPMIGGSEYCRRFTFRAGIPPIGNNIFSTFCFEGKLLKSVGTPAYDATYTNYKKFAKKLVATKVREYIESGTELEATIYELDELTMPDESMFAVEQSNEPIQTVIVSEETLRGISLYAPAVEWPPIQGGKTSGVLSIYVCVDREGKVRETYGLNSDHPVMTDAARQQLMKWQFKPALSKGVPAQIESILTFAYETRIAPASEGGR